MSKRKIPVGIEKFKEIPNNIKIYTYFSFLYSVCFAPLKRNWDIRGLDFRDINNKYLKKENIGYQYIVLGISDKKYIKINEFTKNDSNVDILELSTKIKIKKIGGYI